MAIYAVYGASGCGRSLMPVAREQCHRQSLLRHTDEIYFIDDGLDSSTVHTINGHRAVNYQQFLQLEAAEKHVVIAIANSQVRAKIAHQLQQDQIQLWSIQSDQSIVMDGTQIAAGAAISPWVTFGANSQVGCCFHANLYSYIEHDCVIGDFVTFAPSVKCNGNIHIDDHVYVGAGAMIRQGNANRPLHIGRGAVIGMGAVVLTDVPAGVTVVGNPARILR